MNKQNSSTIYDVAAAAGVSVSTVSRVINHYGDVKRSTSEKVLKAMNELSFDIEKARKASVRRALNGNIETKKDTAQLFVMSVPKLNNSFYADIIEGAQTAAGKNGHHMLINNTLINSLNSDFYINLLKSHNIAGMILTESLSSTALTKVRNHFPLVQCSEYNEEFNDLSYVSIADTQSTYRMTTYFLSLGYKKIAYFTTPLSYQYAIRRKRGYLTALTEAGLTPNPNWMMEFSDFDIDKIIPRIEQLLRTNSPEAIICISDTFAAAAIKACEALRLQVPDDIAIMGMDDTPAARSTTPTISTVRQPRYQLGYAAFEILLNEILHPHAAKQQIVLDTTLIFRDSTPK